MTDPYRVGGLMRCCINTLKTRRDPGEEGGVQPCLWCDSSMRFTGGAWEWAKDIEQEGKRA